MASVHFYLNKAWSYNKIQETQKINPGLFHEYQESKLQVNCLVSTVGRRIKVYTSKRIEPIYWDFEKERANTKIYKKHGVVLNEFLNELESSVGVLAEKNENNGKLTTIEEVRELIEPRNAKKQITYNQIISFDDMFKTFVEEHKTDKGFPIRVNTLKKYKGFKRYVEEFSQAKRFCITPDKITLELLSSFQTFLNNKEDMSDSTKAKYIKGFKTFIKFHQKRGLIKNFDVSDIKVKESEGEVYVVSLQLLIKLQNETMFKSSRLAEIRDIFCFMCWTGQRFSDYVTMKRKDLIEDENGSIVWQLSAKKIVHSKLLKVPIVNYAKAILDRYKKDSLPIPTISNQKFNEALKEMGKKAKMNLLVKTVRYYNGIAKTDTVPFHQILTAHVARKTFITNSLILGVPERVVREISDHKDEKSFRRYVNLADSYKNNVFRQALDPTNVERVLSLIGNYEKYSETETAA